MGGCVGSGTVAGQEREEVPEKRPGDERRTKDRGEERERSGTPARKKSDAPTPARTPAAPPHPVFEAVGVDAAAQETAPAPVSAELPLDRAVFVLEQLHKSGVTPALLKSGAKTWDAALAALGVTSAALARLVRFLQAAVDAAIFHTFRPAIDGVVDAALSSGDSHTIPEVLVAAKPCAAAAPGYAAADVHYALQFLSHVAALAPCGPLEPQGFYVASLTHLFSTLRGSVVKPSTGMVLQRQLQNWMAVFRDLLACVGVLVGDAGEPEEEEGRACPMEAIGCAWFSDLPLLLLDPVSKGYLVYVYCVADQRKLVLPSLRRHEIIIDAKSKVDAAGRLSDAPRRRGSQSYGDYRKGGGGAQPQRVKFNGRQSPGSSLDSTSASCPGVYKVFPTFQDASGTVEAGEGHGPRKEFFELLARHCTLPCRPERDLTCTVSATLRKGSHTVVLTPVLADTGDCVAPPSLPITVGSLVWFKGVYAEPDKDGADGGALHVTNGDSFSAMITSLEYVDANKTPQDEDALKMWWGTRAQPGDHALPPAAPEHGPENTSSSLEYSSSTAADSTRAGRTSRTPDKSPTVSASSEPLPVPPITLQVALDRPAPSNVASAGVLIESAHSPLFTCWDGQTWWFNAAYEDSPVDAQTLMAYEFAGWAMGQSVGNGVSLNLGLPVLFFHLLQVWEMGRGCLVSCETVDRYPSPLTATVKQVRALSDAEYKAMLEGEGLSFDLSRDAYLAAYLRSFVVDAIAPRMDSFVMGFRSTGVDQMPLFKRFTPYELALVLQGRCDDGVSDFVFADEFALAATSDFHAAAHNEVFLNLIWEVIESGLGATPAQKASRKRAFLKFLTGQASLSAHAKADTLTLVLPYSVFNADVFDQHLHRLPMSHTCDNTIELPNYMESVLFGSASPWYALADVKVGVSVLRRHREGCWALLSETQREEVVAQVRRVLIDRLATAAFNTDSYELDETDDYDPR